MIRGAISIFCRAFRYSAEIEIILKIKRPSIAGAFLPFANPARYSAEIEPTSGANLPIIFPVCHFCRKEHFHLQIRIFRGCPYTAIAIVFTPLSSPRPRLSEGSERERGSLYSFSSKEEAAVSGHFIAILGCGSVVSRILIPQSKQCCCRAKLHLAPSPRAQSAVCSLRAA